MQLPAYSQMLPDEIETLSFSIIEEEAGNHGFGTPEWDVVRRMIHTTADFDYIDTVRFHPMAVSAGIAAISEGRAVISDTNMIRAGLRKKDLAAFGCSVTCLVDDPIVHAAARDKQTTRSLAAVDASLELMAGGIYVIGNAPTALLRLITLIQEKKAFPALVVGLPVGFVNAAESKAGLAQLDIPYITNFGRKGGSNVAAAVVNSLVIQAKQNRREGRKHG